MPYAPNANWNAATAAYAKSVVYFININGYTAYEFSTGAVKSQVITKKRYLSNLSGSGQRIEPLHSRASIGAVRFDLIDKAGDITALLATEAPGAALTTLVNRKVTLYAGYADLAEADYAPIFIGFIETAKWRPGLWSLSIRDVKWQLDKTIMNSSHQDNPTILRGNVVNLYRSILRDSFSTSGDFPLTTISGATPKGIGLAAGLVDEAGLKVERNTLLWRAGVNVSFDSPVNAKAWLETELFGAIGWPVIKGDGKLGFRALTQPKPVSVVTKLSASNVVGGAVIDRRLDLHFNRVRIWGNYQSASRKDDGVDTVLDASAASGQKVIPVAKTDSFSVGHEYMIEKADESLFEIFAVASIAVGVSVTAVSNLTNSYVAGDHVSSEPYDVLYSADDTADQTATGEIIQFEWKSKGLDSSAALGLYGDRVAKKIGARVLKRYLKTPAELEVYVLFTQRGVEVGDHLVLTDANLPNLDTGLRGVTERPFEVIDAQPDFQRGLMKLKLLGSDFGKRRMFFSPVGTAGYLTNKGTEKEWYGYHCDPSDNKMSNDDPPYLIQ